MPQYNPAHPSASTNRCLVKGGLEGCWEDPGWGGDFSRGDHRQIDDGGLLRRSDELHVSATVVWRQRVVSCKTTTSRRLENALSSKIGDFYWPDSVNRSQCVSSSEKSAEAIFDPLGRLSHRPCFTTLEQTRFVRATALMSSQLTAQLNAGKVKNAEAVNIFVFNLKRLIKLN